MPRGARKRRSRWPLAGPTGFRSRGRRGGIRTRDPLHPMQVRYQAALHAEVADYSPAFELFLHSVDRTEQIADFKQLAAQQLQLLAERVELFGRGVLELALAE